MRKRLILFSPDYKKQEYNHRKNMWAIALQLTEEECRQLSKACKNKAGVIKTDEYTITIDENKVSITDKWDRLHYFSVTESIEDITNRWGDRNGMQKVSF